MIDITDQQRALVCKLLRTHLPDTRVWAYGSRVKRSSTHRSDLDLVAFSTREQRDQVVELQEAFDESDLPFRVDLFVWDSMPDGFREGIESDHEVLVG